MSGACLLPLGGWSVDCRNDKDDTDGITVRNGTGGIEAQLDDIDAAANVLLQASLRLARTVAEVAALSAMAQSLLVAGGPAAPLSFPGAQLAVAGANIGPNGTLTCGARLAALGTMLRQTVATYRACDQVAAKGFAVAKFAVGYSVGRLVIPLATTGTLAAWALDWQTKGRARVLIVPATQQLSTFISSHPTLTEHGISMLPGFLTGVANSAPLGGAAWSAATHTPPISFTPRDFANRASNMKVPGAIVTETGTLQYTRTTKPGTMPKNLTDIVNDTYTGSPSYQRSDGTRPTLPTIRVEKITGADGNRSWIVHVPGTEKWGVRPDKIPFDLTTNVSAVGGRESAVSKAVIDSMRHAGIRQDEKVLLSGHSLGGIVAGQIAEQQGKQREFTISHVVAFGSPIGAMEIPQSTKVLAMEHGNDIVPMLDGTANPDRANWTTVTRDIHKESGAIANDFGQAHAGKVYEQTATMIDKSHDPEFLRWRQELAPFLARPGAKVSALDVTPQRVLP